MAKYSGYDVDLGVDDGAGGFMGIAHLRDIAGPGIGNETTETTCRDSGGWKEYVGGLKDGGEVTFDVVYDPTGATHDGSTGLVALADSGEVKGWQVLWPGGVAWTFDGIVTKLEPKAPMADALTADVTIKISGQPTLA